MNELIKLMTSRFKSGALWPNSTGPASLTSFLEYITKWEQNTKNGVGFISKSTATGFRVTLTSVSFAGVCNQGTWLPVLDDLSPKPRPY